MRAVFQKVYFTIQALVLTAGFALTCWVVYQAYTLESDEYKNARNCALGAISQDIPLWAANKHSDQWTSLVRGSIMLKGDLKSINTEADRISKACSKFLAIEVASDTGEVSLFIVNGDKYKSAQDLRSILYALGLVIGGTALLSVLLFILKKWIGIVFK